MTDTKLLSEDEREVLEEAKLPGGYTLEPKDVLLLVERLVAEREKNAELLREASRIIGLLKSSLAKVREENAAFREQMLQVARDADAEIARMRGQK